MEKKKGASMEKAKSLGIVYLLGREKLVECERRLQHAHDEITWTEIVTESEDIIQRQRLLLQCMPAIYDLYQEFYAVCMEVVAAAKNSV